MTNDNGCGYILSTLGELFQHTIVSITVKQHNGLLGAANQVGDELVSVKYLAIAEDTLFGKK